MPGLSSFPNGFPGGLMVSGLPILLTNAGKVFWVSNATTGLLAGQRGGSDGNKGNFNSPFSTLQAAINAAVANRGDVILIKPGHAETISSATALLFNKAGVTIMGLGDGSARPIFTLDTANTATIAVSAASITIQNCRFVANFLSIAACFTVASAFNFAVIGCIFRETSSVLNFLNIIKTTGAANTADGLMVTDNTWSGIGTTSVNSFILSADAIANATILRNKVKLAKTTDTSILITMTAGILTNLECGDNMVYSAQTATTAGSLINVGGTTSTGWVYRNYAQTLSTTDKLFTTTVGLGAFDNRVSGVIGASGYLIPATDA